MAIKALFIANRGEIAVRIIKAAKALGIQTIQAVSAADKDMLAVAAGRLRCRNRAGARHQILSEPGGVLVAAAIASGADAVHPGYGFLAENARLCGERRGGRADLRRAEAGNNPRDGRQGGRPTDGGRAGVPIVPGSEGRIEGVEAASRCGACDRLPADDQGGGGRRRTRYPRRRDAAEFETMISLSDAPRRRRLSATAGSISSNLWRARAMSKCKSSATASRAIHLYERECSLQRRRQKVWEEAPASCLTRRSARSGLRLCGEARSKRRLSRRRHA